MLHLAAPVLLTRDERLEVAIGSGVDSSELADMLLDAEELNRFGELRVQQLSWSLLGPGLLVALLAGLAGGLFSRLVVASARGLPDRFCRLRARHPLRFAAACAFVVAVIGVVAMVPMISRAPVPELPTSSTSAGS